LNSSSVKRRKLRRIFDNPCLTGKRALDEFESHEGVSRFRINGRQAELDRRTESKALIEARMPDDDDDLAVLVRTSLETPAKQLRANASVLKLRQHRHGR
jgi:hypothetical protein